MPKSTSLLLSTVIVSSMLLAACQPSTPAESNNPVSPTTAVTVQMTPTPTAATTGSATDADGKEVSTETTYNTPAGEEKVGFTLLLDDAGVITEAKVDELGKAPISKVRQAAFAKDITAAVKGKKLSELTKIDRVGGSSLTTGAFNQALTELKTQI